MWLSSMTMHGTLQEDTFEKKYIHLEIQRKVLDAKTADHHSFTESDNRSGTAAQNERTTT